MLLQAIQILIIVILSPLAMLMLIVSILMMFVAIGLISVAIGLIRENREIKLFQKKTDDLDINYVIDELRFLLSDYYFNNPLPEDVTDDTDLLVERTDKRVGDMSDIEILEEVVNLYKQDKLEI